MNFIRNLTILILGITLYACQPSVEPHQSFLNLKSEFHKEFEAYNKKYKEAPSDQHEALKKEAPNIMAYIDTL